MPLAAPLAEIALKVAARLPLARLTGVPVVLLIVTSATVRVPKPLPLIPVPVVFLSVSPRTVLFDPRLMPLPLLVISAIVALLLFVAGSAALLAPGVRPVIAERVVVASCPISFWPARSVTGPV